jgi:hypothetical protein
MGLSNSVEYEKTSYVLFVVASDNPINKVFRRICRAKACLGSTLFIRLGSTLFIRLGSTLFIRLGSTLFIRLGSTSFIRLGSMLLYALALCYLYALALRHLYVLYKQGIRLTATKNT